MQEGAPAQTLRIFIENFISAKKIQIEFAQIVLSACVQTSSRGQCITMQKSCEKMFFQIFKQTLQVS